MKIFTIIMFSFCLSKLGFAYECHLEQETCSCDEIDENIILMNCLQTNNASFRINLSSIDLDSNPNKSFHIRIENKLKLEILASTKNIASVTRLKFKNNKINSIDSNAFSGLNNLQVLNLMENEIRNISYGTFKHFKSLQTLDLSNNQISIIEPCLFDELSELKELFLTTNSLKEIKFDFIRNLTQLEWLHLSENFIEDFKDSPFRNLNKLLRLFVSSNRITHIKQNDFQGLNLLEKMRIHKNKIESIEANSFDSLPNLRTLYIYSNKLKEFDSDLFKNLVYLEYLWIDSNEVTSIQSNLVKPMQNLFGFWLSKNKVTVLERFLFKNFSQLEEIGLDENEIAKIEPFTFCEMRSLKYIQLNLNKIEVIEANVFANLSDYMEVIDLSNNRIIKYGVNKFKHLNLFNLSHNFLDGLNGNKNYYPFKGLEHLIKLDLSFNLIVIIETNFLRHLNSLESLYLNNNGLEKIEPLAFEHLFALEYLNLRQNNLKKLNKNSFYNLSNLINLDIAHNKIASVSFLKSNLAFLSNLQVIDLSFNFIDTINEDDFTFSLNLKSINLNNNLIKLIHEQTFNLHRQLEAFKMAKNRLDYFNLSLLNGTQQNLQELDLSFNKIGLNDPWLEFNSLKSIRAEQCHFSVGFFLKSLDIVSIDFSSNNLDQQFYIFNNLTLVERLELRNVSLISMKQIAFRKFFRLKYLDLSHNYLKRLDFEDFETFIVRFEYLDVSSNQLYSIDEAIFYATNQNTIEDNSISYLNFENNNLSILVSKYLYNYLNLKTLKLSFNSITFVPLFLFNNDYNHNPLYEEFYFDHNEIVMLTSFNIWIHTLKILNLDYNKIVHIENDALLNLISLQNFSIAMNRLTRIEKTFFQKNYDLKYLNLSQNLIETIEADSFLNLNKLLALDLSFNCLKRLEANLFMGLHRLSSLYLKSYDLIELNNQSFRHLNRISNVYLNENEIIENKCLFMHSLFDRAIQRNLSNRYLFYKSINLITSDIKTSNICSLTFHLLQMKIHLNLKTDYENELFYDMCENLLIRFSNVFWSNLRQCNKNLIKFDYKWLEEYENASFNSSLYLVLTNYFYLLTMGLLLSLLIPVSFLIFNHLLITEL